MYSTTLKYIYTMIKIHTNMVQGDQFQLVTAVITRPNQKISGFALNIFEMFWDVLNSIL